MAVFCPVTLRFQIYPIPIPLRLDNAYTAELYTAWVALTARGPSADPTFVFRSSSEGVGPNGSWRSGHPS